MRESMQCIPLLERMSYQWNLVVEGSLTHKRSEI